MSWRALRRILLFSRWHQYWQPPVVWFAIAGVQGQLPSSWQRLLPSGLGLDRNHWGSVLRSFYYSREGSAITALVAVSSHLELSERVENGEVIAYQLDTKRHWVSAGRQSFARICGSSSTDFSRVPSEWDAYNLPYHTFTRVHERSGSGRRNEQRRRRRARIGAAGHVVAVEIDPLILNLGRECHFGRPIPPPASLPSSAMHDPYVENSKERFVDLIVLFAPRFAHKYFQLFFG